MLGFAFTLWQFNLPTSALILSSFLTSFLFAVWFACSETVISKSIASQENESIQKLIVLSNHSGQVLGPPISGFLFGTIGLVGIAFINAISFILQALSLKRATHKDTSSMAIYQQTYFKTVMKGLRAIKASPTMGTIILTSIFPKALLLGIPFIAFKLAQDSMDKKTIGISLACLSIGTIISGIVYKPQGNKKLGASYKVNATFMIAFGFTSILVGAASSNIYLISICLFAWGWFIARYQILFRSIRQVTKKPETYPTLILSAGILARSGTVFSGAIFGLLFNSTLPLSYFIGIAALFIALLYKVNSKMQEKYQLYIGESSN